MISILIIGNGNVAHHLQKAFKKINTLSVMQIGSRNLNKIPFADITIIAVSDNAISEVSKKITNPFVVHTAGNFDLKSLQNNTRKGVFYMLQSFSKATDVNFSQIPFCLEAENNEDYLVLESLAKTLGNKIYKIDSKQRKLVHVSAVFVNNFTNHLYKISRDICSHNNIPFEILFPLIAETARKIEVITPEQAQTGPAVRNDTKTISNHLELLSAQHQEIYSILTKSIQENTHSQKTLN
ncbi:DUF2520 domain-containing protein [Polaribacter tangerinus]